MRIAELRPRPDWVLSIVANDSRVGSFDVSPYLACEAFAELRDHSEFMKVVNGGYFVEWDCGADLSAPRAAASAGPATGPPIGCTWGARQAAVSSTAATCRRCR